MLIFIIKIKSGYSITTTISSTANNPAKISHDEITQDLGLFPVPSRKCTTDQISQDFMPADFEWDLTTISSPTPALAQVQSASLPNLHLMPSNLHIKLFQGCYFHHPIHIHIHILFFVTIIPGFSSKRGFFTIIVIKLNILC